MELEFTESVKRDDGRTVETEFDLYFSLAAAGSTNENILSFADLIVADPNIESRYVNGHIVGLGEFDGQQ